MLKAIADRRSIRQYADRPVPKAMIEDIVRAGMLAPSSKNRQPWRFVVVSGGAKEEMLRAMLRGLEREERVPLLPNSACHMEGARHTLEIMRQAPVVIAVVNALGQALGEPLSPEERVYEICNAQSIGAALENMTLEATELGLGSLWICDTFFAQWELSEWLGAKGVLTAAMAIGYADEMPHARPRKSMADIVEWRCG